MFLRMENLILLQKLATHLKRCSVTRMCNLFLYILKLHLTEIKMIKSLSFVYFLTYKGPFIFYEGGGAGGIWEAPFKNRMTPLSLPIFSHGPPL